MNAPPWLLEQTNQAVYTKWLFRKAAALHRRDKKRGSKSTRAEYVQAIHKAVVKSNGVDHWTGERLHWNLIGTYDNTESKKGRSAYKRDFNLLPTIDHRIANAEPDFVICGWGMNDAKHDMTPHQMYELCQAFIKHNRDNPDCVAQESRS
ncbi:hypothetical protein [Cyanobium sp. ATX 6F1]|uniref:hypothetical protein n=1 Tax=unclassified Cyanobium TaxID=2627006 RepID=UPI0020CC4C3E|nr:hypothetical protein [Cyanobium sp. ATX 6F1]MCP9916246.1 hypothetical protein [Cyanobium sp. ATX 6F1]